jgi:hypothetical protein
MMSSDRERYEDWFAAFSDCLADLNASCKASDTEQVFSDFEDTFQSCIDVMDEILHYIGFKDTVLGIRRDTDEIPLTEEEEYHNELQLIGFAADDKNMLLYPEDLRSWEKMARDSHLKMGSFDAEKLQRKIADVYLPLLKQFYDLASKFYDSPEKKKAMVGKTEILYVKWGFCIEFRTRRVRRYFAKGEKMLRGFCGVKVYHNISAYQDIVSEYGPEIYPGVDAFWQLKGYVIFTNRRIIVVRFKEKRDQKEYYFTYPYGKINYFEIRRALPWTKKRGLFFEFAGGPSLCVHFKSRWFVRFHKIVSEISDKLIK